YFTPTQPIASRVMEGLEANIQNPVEPIAKRRGEAVDDAIEAMLARALAKEPGNRHASAAAFRYELNTVMDMLDMGRRRSRGSGALRSESTREAAITQAFERSRVPQALPASQGTLVVTNAALAKPAPLDEHSPDG